MQQSPKTLGQKLIDAVDEKDNVSDMGRVIEILGSLENLEVSKELLEATRLGKFVNDFRRKIKNEHLAKRAKNLLKKWRDAVKLEDSSNSTQKPQNGSAVSHSQISEGPSQGPGTGVEPINLPMALNMRLGINSTSSSPKFPYSSNVSPCWSQNSNSLSPGLASKLTLNNNNNTPKTNSSIPENVLNCNSVNNNSNDASSCSTANTVDETSTTNCTSVNFESALGSVSSVNESMPSSPFIPGADDSSSQVSPASVSVTTTAATTPAEPPTPAKKRRRRREPGYIDQHELLRQHIAKAQAEGRFDRKKTKGKSPKSKLRKSTGSRTADTLSPAGQPLKPLQPLVHSKNETDSNVTPSVKRSSKNKSTSLKVLGEPSTSSLGTPSSSILRQQPPHQPVNAPSLVQVESSESLKAHHSSVTAPPSIDWGDSDDEQDFQEVPIPTPGTLGSEGSGIASVPSVPEETAGTTSLMRGDVEFMMDVEDDVVIVKKDITEEDVERLHSEKLENLNGNTGKDGVFYEWHEPFAVESYKQEILHVLPYTLIDF